MTIQTNEGDLLSDSKKTNLDKEKKEQSNPQIIQLKGVYFLLLQN